MFQYKTRGKGENSNPQGKQKVYFTCHLDDFDKYFEKISDQILGLENCAVWYLDSEENYQDMETDLGGMKLFVIPVTTKLLTTPNRAVDTDLPFALKKHIPVLPLMQENGLDELFNKKFGSLHYLNENARDDTAAPYEEKLKRHLSSVLVGDKLAAKVRAAFDAYIFLSYRKKDRKHAQELMRLIHKNDFCRDIAIWYDEFLTPGENFNSAIEGALKKSELFALVVTPNLVNEQNYVQSTEYPMAKNAKKKILPAELVNTDHKKLSEMYPDIPGCVDAENSVQLSETLMDSLQSIAKAENDGDPQHNFLIGLAYLNGIDVEIDTERAKALLTSSAEAGLIVAMKKLVSMYQNGDGVERDYLKAIEWQRKLIEQLREAYVSSGSLQDGRKSVNALWHLGDFLFDIRSFSEAESAYKEMGDIALKLSLRRNLSVSYVKLGSIRQAQGRLSEAEVYFKKCLNLSEALAEETKTVESRSDLAVSYGNLGGIRQAQGNLTEAEAYHKKRLELFEELAEETKTVESRRNVAIGYINLGDIRKAQGNLTEAEAYYKKYHELSEELTQETKTAMSHRDLAISYERLGAIRKAQENLTEAEAYYKKGFELSEKLAEEMKTVESRRDLAIGYGNLGEIYETQGNLTEAEAYYKKRLELLEELGQETKTVGSRRDLTISYAELGDIRRAQGNLSEAEVYYKKAFELSEELAEETKTVESRRDLAISYAKLGDIRKAQGNLTEAEAHYKKDLELSEELAEETKTVESRRDLSASYEKLGDIRRAQRNLTEAEAYYKKALELREELAEETKTVESCRDLSVSYERFGDIREAQGKLPEAEAYYKKALELREELAEETKTVELRRDLAISYERLGDIRQAQGKLLEAEAYYKKTLELREELAEETKTVELRRDLSVSYERFGDIREAQGKLSEAEAYYKKEIELLEELEELALETKTVDFYDNLGISYCKCAMVKNPPDIVLLKQAYPIYDALAKRYPSVLRYAQIRDQILDVIHQCT